MVFSSVVPEALKTAYDVFKFSPGVVVGDRLIISGQMGVNPDLSVPVSLEDEIATAFTYIGLILEEAGTDFDHVVELQSYHVSSSLMADVGVFNMVRARFMKEPHCAWSTFGVDKLLIPGGRVEIRAEAIIPSG
jgi:enamine deaminase RidA (YjgF/YER057c/UK114 family)